MSKELLYKLNGSKEGGLLRWLKNFNGEPRIAWYPSAGGDFRDLLYLNPAYLKTNPPSFEGEPNQPDIFLHTDYFPWSNSTFLDNAAVYRDDRTIVSVKSIEELPKCNLPLDNQIVVCPDDSHATGRVCFLDVEIESDKLGKISAPVIYAFVENAAFCGKLVIPQNARFSHVVHVRFGGGSGGGGKSSGIWLLNVLRKIHCEVFVTDSHFSRQSGDKRVYELYPALSGNEDSTQLKPIRVIKGEGWSGHGDVSWNIINDA